MLSTITEVIRNVVSPFQIVLRHLYRGDIYQRLQEVNLEFLSPIQSQILIFFRRYHHPKVIIWSLENLHEVTISFIDISTSSRRASSVSSSEGNLVNVFRRSRNSSSRVMNPLPFKSYVRKTTKTKFISGLLRLVVLRARASVQTLVR